MHLKLLRIERPGVRSWPTGAGGSGDGTLSFWGAHEAILSSITGGGKYDFQVAKTDMGPMPRLNGQARPQTGNRAAVRVMGGAWVSLVALERTRACVGCAFDAAFEEALASMRPSSKIDIHHAPRLNLPPRLVVASAVEAAVNDVQSARLVRVAAARAAS